jgi:hypothetical protein
MTTPASDDRETRAGHPRDAAALALRVQAIRPDDIGPGDMKAVELKGCGFKICHVGGT